MASTMTQLICNRYGGIRHKNAVFNENIITASDVQNVELYNTGLNDGVGIKTSDGNVSINNSLVGTERIINIFETIQKGKSYFLVHTVSDTEGKFYIYDIPSNTLTLKKEGLSITDTSVGFDLIQGFSDLFFFTNGKEMFTLEIETDTVKDMNDLEDRDGRKVLGLVAGLFDGRLWIASGNILWYSMKANIYDFKTADSDWQTSAGYIEYLKDITAIHEYLNSLAIFFKDSSVLLSINNGTLSQGDDSPGGCAGVGSLIFHDTNLYFYDDTKKAVFSFRQIVTGEKALGENIAIEIQDLLLNIDSNNLNMIKTLSVVLENRNEIWWLMPTTDPKYSTVLIFDYIRGEWLKRKCQKINSVKIINNNLYSAGNDGNILQEYQGNTFNGEFIQHYYNYTPLNLGAMNTLKIFVFPPRVSFDLPSTNNFYVKYVKDFNVFKKPKIKLIKGKFKNFMYWGISRWGEKYWASSGTNAIGKFPNATFKILEMSIYTENELQSFKLKNLEFSKIKVKQV